MKKAIFLLCLLAGIFILPSCNKKPGCNDPSADNYEEAANYDDGSCTYNLTFLSRVWLLTKYEVDGQDSSLSLLASKPNLSLTFFREQTYKEIYYPGSGSQVVKNGIWAFEQNYTGLTLVEKPNDSSRTFLINTLNDTALIISIQNPITRRYIYRPKS